MVTDDYNAVIESNESDNEWQQDFYWGVSTAQPNLAPYIPSGWDYPIVPSSVQGTHTVNNLYANQNTHIDWAVINNGGAGVSVTYYTCLYFDGTEIQCWYTEGLNQGWYAYVEDWTLNLTPSAGWHTLRMVTDVYNAVAESNEGDNAWENGFYWNAPSCGPYTQADDLLIPDDGTWQSRAIDAGQRPEDALAGEVSVKYKVQHPAPQELEIRLVNEATGIAYDIWNHGAAGEPALEETILDIEAYRGQPVGEDWRLEMRDTQPGNVGTLDYVSVRVRYAPLPEAALYDASGDASGRPAMLRLPAGALDNARPVEDYDLKGSQSPASPGPIERQPGPTAWEAIATEDFEGLFPGSNWTLLDLSDDGCDFLWDDDDNRPHGGSWAGWPASGGANGLDPATSNYPPNMNSWMIYGPMDLSDAIDADAWFDLWLQTELDWDKLFFGVSSDGVNFNGIQWSGTADWTFHDVYYTDYVGDASVWVAWVFQSDSIINYEGAWIDDIIVWKDVGGPYDCGITTAMAMLSVDDSAIERDRSLPNWDVPSFNSDDPYEIRLKSRRFTPQRGLSPELTRQLETWTADKPPYGLVQLEQIPSLAERQVLDELGVSLLRYIPQRAWIASIPTRSLTDLSDFEFIRWIGELHLEDKLEPALTSDVFYPWAYDPETGEIAVIVQLMADVSIADGLSIVQAHGGKVHDRIRSINALVVWIDKNELPDLAAEDTVEWIEQAPAPYSPLNDCIRAMIGVDTLQAAPYSLNGTEVDVLVYDAGTVATTHEAFDGRLTIGDTSSTHDHATHVAGTVGGSGIGSPAGRDLKGMAPNADIISYGFEYDGTGVFLYTNPGDIEDDWAEARTTYGADIGTASLGTNTAANGFPCEYEGDYGATSQLLDAIVRGSLGAPYIATWANGNERGSGRCGTTYHTTAPPANAKNPIQVGASNSNEDIITGFSSWGPSDDGRLKPIVSAPGCESQGEYFINSTLPPNTYGEQGYCGTSMATPAVAGVVALMLQQYRLTYSTGGEFLPSTAKAVLMQTSVDLGNTGPDYQSGYGRVNAVGAADTIVNGDFREGTFNSQNQVEIFEIVVEAGLSELRASLAWDDYPATLGANQQLVNDLDLVLIGPDSTVHYPWILDSDNPDSPATRGADHLNNQEQVVVTNPPAGVWTVRISATSLPQAPQSYSIVFPGAQTAPRNNPPNTPSNPSPSNGATGVSISADLSWAGGDPDPGDTVTYDVYFEANDSTPDNLICNDISTSACDPGTLAYSTHYYWYVVAADNHGASTTSTTWDFTTSSAPNNPPNTPSNPSPPNGATGVSINADLSWTGGDPDPGDTVTYDVYFEANDSTPDSLLCNDASTPTCDPGMLAYNTHYYWYVVATDNHDASTNGTIWDFTTETPSSPPGPATPISPAGLIDDNTPTYTWYAVDSATWYYLMVEERASGDKFTRWVEASGSCVAGVCSFTQPSALNNGEHIWWVQTYNDAGYGPWSTGLEFWVGDLVPPATPVPTAPSGANIPSTPTYTWQVVPTATWYQLYVSGPLGTVTNQWVEARSHCETAGCSVTPSAPLSGGPYQWWVRAWSRGGLSPWSVRTDFFVGPPLPAPATTLIAPDGTIVDATPTYTWQVVSSATWYWLYVVNRSSGTAVVDRWYLATSVCDGALGTCAATPAAALGDGAYSWWIKTWNPYDGSWSHRLDFTVSTGAAVSQAAELISPDLPPGVDVEGDPPTELRTPPAAPPEIDAEIGPPVDELAPSAGPPPEVNGAGGPPRPIQ
jgi:subtilisin-like proprotein convertase family protein